MRKIIKFTIDLILLYILLFFIVHSYIGEVYNIAVEPIDYEAHSNNTLFPCIKHPVRTIKIKPLDVGKIKEKFFLKMDWGVIDEKVYPSMRVMLHAGYKIKNPDTKSGLLPAYYQMSLDDSNYKIVTEKLNYIGSVRLNYEHTVYIKTCLIPALMDKRNVNPSVRFYYGLQENTFYSAFKLLFNITFWSVVIWLAFKVINIFIKRKDYKK